MISDTLGIDPGTRALGWARAKDGKITHAGLSRAPQIASLAECAEYHARAIGLGSTLRVALESMTYRGVHSQDLLDVQTVGCLVAARVAPTVILYPPSEWKGTIPKAQHHLRILESLEYSERGIVNLAVQSAGKTHAKEVLDAVGILLYAMSRTNRTGARRVTA